MADDGPGGGRRRPDARPRRLGIVTAVTAVTLAVAFLAAACGSGGAEVAGPTTASTSRPPDGTAAVRAAPTPGTAAPTTTPDPTGPDVTGAPAPPGVPLGETPTSAAPAPGAPAAAIPYPVGTVALPLVDLARPTVSGGTTLSTGRSLPTTVAYPTGSGGPFPLLVFAHGFRLGPPGYARLMGVLAAAGYVVAAPSFPLADEAVAGSRVDRGDLPNQPGDVSFVIDGVLAAASDPGSPLAGRVDPGRIGAVGHSDGADTVLEVGYHPTRSDARVRAVVALSPDAVVDAAWGVGGSTPLLLEHGDADPVVPYAESRSVFAAVPARRYFLTLLGAGHLEPVAQATTWTPVLDATVVAFLDRFVAGASSSDEAVTGPATASAVARVDVAG